MKLSRITPSTTPRVIPRLKAALALCCLLQKNSDHHSVMCRSLRLIGAGSLIGASDDALNKYINKGA